MNNELQIQLADMIKSSLSSAHTAKEFLVSQLPVVVHQALVWHFITSFLSFLISVAVFSAPILLVVHCVKAWKRKDEWIYWKYSGVAPEALLLLIPLIIVFLVGSLFFSLSWLQIWVAPKLWLLQYASSLIK
jgi:hypothetical protein